MECDGVLMEIFIKLKRVSAYNYDHANIESLFKIFDMLESEAKSLVEKKYLLYSRV